MNTEFNFSPSFHLRHLLTLTRPALAYEGGSVAARQARLRARLTEMLGFGDEERVPLAPRTLWKKEHALP